MASSLPRQVLDALAEAVVVFRPDGTVPALATEHAAQVHAAVTARGQTLAITTSNWWIGWGPIPEAAEATGADAERSKRLARAAAILTVALWLLMFPVAALLT